MLPYSFPLRESGPGVPTGGWAGGRSPGAGVYPQGCAGCPSPGQAHLSQPLSPVQVVVTIRGVVGLRGDAMQGPLQSCEKKGGYLQWAGPTGLHTEPLGAPRPAGDGDQRAFGLVASQPPICFDRISQMSTNDAELQAPRSFIVSASQGAVSTASGHGAALFRLIHHPAPRPCRETGLWGHSSAGLTCPRAFSPAEWRLKR